MNCCIWSAEVQEVRGALLHVHSAVARGRFMVSTTFISVQTSLHSEPKATVAFEAVHYHRWLTPETNSLVSLQRCERCSQHGATVGCCLSSCQSNYHFMCARASHCVFQSDKKVYCYKHRDLISNKVLCRVKSFPFLHPQACILSIKKNDLLFYR